MIQLGAIPLPAYLRVHPNAAVFVFARLSEEMAAARGLIPGQPA
jgi:hypothetical protein